MSKSEDEKAEISSDSQFIFIHFNVISIAHIEEILMFLDFLRHFRDIPKRKTLDDSSGPPLCKETVVVNRYYRVIWTFSIH